LTKHIEELKEIARLQLGIIVLIEELDKYKENKGIQDYLKDLIEGVDENTIMKKKHEFNEFIERLERNK